MSRSPRARRTGEPKERAAARRTGRSAVAGRIAVTAAAVTAAAAGGAWAWGYGPFAPGPRPDPSPGTIPASTATVIRTSITATEEEPGTLGYDGSFTVYAAVPGTITWLPAPGVVISPGQRLFAVDGQATTLLRGPQPAWRDFTPGMTDGPDVQELQRNLVAGGYDPQRAITIDGHYGWATQAAAERWQAARGVPLAQQDGQIPLGQVVFLPAPVRVAALAGALGATVAPGTPVITATSATPVVDVALPADAEPQVHPGQPVTITLPGGAPTPGRVLRVDQSASSAPSQPGPGSSGTSSAGSSAGGPPPAATVTVVVSLLRPSAAAGLDQAPVQVAIATRTQPKVLAAPISALLARPGGGYQVTVIRGGAQRDVTVRTGLFDDLSGTVAISGPGITAGTIVQVPTS
jgi:peptidoglycan hydrolase-like protein with peptidoglycan-binding domain